MEQIVEAELQLPEKFIVVELNDQTPFDPVRFDQDYKKLGTPEMGIVITAKYIVMDGKMIFFPSGLQHISAEKLAREQGLTGKLQSAGLTTIEYRKRRTVRELADYSPSLEKAHLLTKEESDQYKVDVIKPLLETYFNIKL